MYMFNIILPTFNLRVEKWKWNKEYRVYVSTLGNFKDEYKRNLPIKVSVKNGYCYIKTAVGFRIVQRIVLLTWKPIPDAENLTVDHLNHNKRDNSIYNLEWVTKEENIKRARRDECFEEENTTEDKYDYEIAFKVSKKDFTNYRDMINFCKSKMKPSERNVVKDETIIRNIKKAIRNDTYYLGRKWQLK